MNLNNSNHLIEQFTHQSDIAATDYQTNRMTQDTEDCVNFLLTLKNRSVSSQPEQPQFCMIATKESTSDEDRPDLKIAASESYDSDASPVLAEECIGDISLEKLLLESPLVSQGDRDLVPDPLFIAMAQMKPCVLSEADRVGSYKSRPIGFVGFCCKHCGGQPGFGKYFPASVRSLAQTTTSQTILKHVASKCRFTPPHIRKIIQDLKRQQAAKDAAASNGRPRYGSRKGFFQRVWSRLHDEALPYESSIKEGVGTPVHSDAEEERSSGSLEVSNENSPKRSQAKGSFGLLHPQKNAKHSLPLFEQQQPSPKRQRAANFVAI